VGRILNEAKKKEKTNSINSEPWDGDHCRKRKKKGGGIRKKGAPANPEGGINECPGC